MIWCGVCGSGFREDEIDVDCACPECGSESLTQLCDECEAKIDPDIAIGGLCPKCVKGKINYRNGCDFLTARGYLIDFVFDRLYDAFVPVGQDPDQERRTVDIAQKLYERKVLDDLLNNDQKTLDALRAYIVDDDECFAEVFVDWLSLEEVKG